MSADRARRPVARKDLAGYLGWVEEEARAVLRRRRLSGKTFLDDAIHEGFLGMADAFDRYEERKGASFEAYARPFIRGAILDALDRGMRADPVRVLLRGANAAAADHAEHHEVCEDELGRPRDAVLEVRRGVEGHLAAQGFGFLGAIRKLDPETQLQARRQYAHALEALRPLTAQLARREQAVLGLRQMGVPWEDVALQMGVTRATVQAWHARALDQLRKGLAKRGVTEMPPLPDREDDDSEE